MRKFQKPLAFLFGGIALVTYMSFRFFPQQNVDTPVVALQQGQQYMQVYVLDNEQTLIPLSIEISEDLSIEDKLQLLIAYMCGKQKIKNFQPVFQEELSTVNIQVENKVAVFNFDDTFLKYDVKNELRLLEALSWGATQFDEVDEVQIQLNQTTLTHMPLGNTPIPKQLNRTIGINHFETATATLHNSKALTVFCTKRIEGNVYVVPQTRRVNNVQDLTTLANVILEDIRVSTNLTQPLFEEQIHISNMQLQDKVLTLQVNKNLLGSDQELLQEAYYCLVLSLSLIDGVEQVTLKIETDETSQVMQDQSIQVKDLYYNAVVF